MQVSDAWHFGQGAKKLPLTQTLITCKGVCMGATFLPLCAGPPEAGAEAMGCHAPPHVASEPTQRLCTGPRPM